MEPFACIKNEMDIQYSLMRAPEQTGWFPKVAKCYGRCNSIPEATGGSCTWSDIVR
jgi:hypothetical protein